MAYVACLQCPCGCKYISKHLHANYPFPDLFYYGSGSRWRPHIGKCGSPHIIELRWYTSETAAMIGERDWINDVGASGFDTSEWYNIAEGGAGVTFGYKQSALSRRIPIKLRDPDGKIHEFTHLSQATYILRKKRQTLSRALKAGRVNVTHRNMGPWKNWSIIYD